MQKKAESLAVPEPPVDLGQGISKLEAWARSLIVETPAQYIETVETLKRLKSMRQKVVEFFLPSKTKAHETHKEIVKNEKTFTDRLDSVERLAKPALVGYDRREEDKRMAEQRRLQQEADARARKERERLDKLAEKAQARGDVEKAQDFLDRSETVAAPVVEVASKVPEVSGVANRKTWKAEIIDLNAFMIFVHKNMRDDLVTPNEKVLDQYAKAMRERAVMAGVRFSEVTTMAIGRGV